MKSLHLHQNKNQRKIKTHRLKAAEYAARTANPLEPPVHPSSPSPSPSPPVSLSLSRSPSIAAVSSAVDSTMCGHPPRCIHMDTRATAICFCLASSSSLCPFVSFWLSFPLTSPPKKVTVRIVRAVCGGSATKPGSSDCAPRLALTRLLVLAVVVFGVELLADGEQLAAVAPRSEDVLDHVLWKPD